MNLELMNALELILNECARNMVTNIRNGEGVLGSNKDYLLLVAIHEKYPSLYEMWTAKGRRGTDANGN
jgi:hypothetical protein